MLGKCGYLLLSLATHVVENTELRRIKTYAVLQLSAGERHQTTNFYENICLKILFSCFTLLAIYVLA